MLDNDLFRNIIAILKQGMEDIGFTADNRGALNYLQSFQPTQQGVPTASTVFIHKLFDTPLGTPERKSYWEPDTDTGGEEVHKETQWYESTFQLDALSIQNPKSSQQLTASDILNYARYVLQSDYAIAAFRDVGLAFIRISEVRNPYFTDDRDRFEASPSFDFTVEHEQAIITTAPVADRIVINIERV